MERPGIPYITEWHYADRDPSALGHPPLTSAGAAMGPVGRVGRREVVTKAGREGSADPRATLHGSTWDLSVCGVESASGPGSRLWEPWGRRAGSSNARLTTGSKPGHGSHKSVAVGSSLLMALCSVQKTFFCGVVNAQCSSGESP